MKILIAPDSYLPRVGGAEVYAYKLATFLKKEGHDVALLTTEEGTWERDNEFPVYRLQFPKNPVIFIQSLMVYARLVSESDIVHTVYSHKLATLGGILARLMGKRLIISEQGRGILDLPDNSWVHARIHEFYRSVSIKLSYHFIASCREFVDIARRYTTRDKISYMPNSVDTEEFVPLPKDYSVLPFSYNKGPLIVSIRRLVPKNGVQFLIEAIPKIVNRVPNATFVVIGWGRLEEHLKSRVRELGIEDKVYFLGKIENFKLKEYLNLADVVVFPSTAESTSIACLESMALGKAIVASRVGGYPEMIIDGQSGTLVNLTDTEASDYDAPMNLPDNKLEELAKAVSDLALDTDKRRRFGENARTRAVSEFSWEKNIQTILSLYRKQ